MNDNDDDDDDDQSNNQSPGGPRDVTKENDNSQ